MLTSKITSYNPAWPAMFKEECNRISPAFGDELIQIYHVGSTAIPEISAKPEIDILVEVSDHRLTHQVDTFMRSCGYVRGSNLSDGHHFYRRDIEGIRTHKVHVCHIGHSQISQMLHFRNQLRREPILRKQYQQLKLSLEAENTGGIGEYLERKRPFIDKVLANQHHFSHNN